MSSVWLVALVAGAAVGLGVGVLAAITATHPERVRSFGSILGTGDGELAEPDATPARGARA